MVSGVSRLQLYSRAQEGEGEQQRRCTPPLEEDEYAEFYEVNEPVIKFEGGVNEIQRVQHSTANIVEEQVKDKVWSKLTIRVERGRVPERAATREKAQCLVFKWFSIM